MPAGRATLMSDRPARQILSPGQPFTPSARMRFSLRPAAWSDQELLYSLTRQAIGPYVTLVRGWDEEDQQARFRRRFDPARWRVITRDGAEVGALELDPRPGELFLSNFLLFPEHQRKGIGTAVMQELLRDARAEGRCVRLRVLKVNPARRLYEWLGFIHEGETETHHLMVAAPRA